MRDALLEALRLDPHHAWSHDALGQWYLEAGDLNAALSHSTRAIELSPGDPDLLISHAFVLHALRRQAEAWQLIEPLVAHRAGVRSACTAVRSHGAAAASKKREH